VRGWVDDDGTGHATTGVAAPLTLVPDGGGPSWSGGYVSHQAGQFTASGDDERVVTTTTHGGLTGTDGSTYRIREVAHVVVEDDGTPRVWFDRFSCTPA
jgi:hypothetical protein